jgi:hypothetical protein
MALSTKLVPLASNLINKYGTTFTLTTNITSAYNTSTGAMSKTGSNQILKGIIEEYADSIRFLGNKLEANNLILEGDKKLTLASKDVSAIPTPGMDTVIIQIVKYSIIGVATQFADDLPVYYVLHIRKV